MTCVAFKRASWLQLCTMSVNILTHCTQRPPRPFQAINMILQGKNPIQFFIGSSSIQICQASGYCKMLRRDCVDARFDTEQKILAWSPSINQHMPCSHDREYPKKISPWRDCQCDSPTPVEKGNCNIGTENRMASVPIKKNQWPFRSSWDTVAHQTILECFCLVASILGLRRTWNVFCSRRFHFNCLDIFRLEKSCLQLQ